MGREQNYEKNENQAEKINFRKKEKKTLQTQGGGGVEGQKGPLR